MIADTTPALWDQRDRGWLPGLGTHLSLVVSMVLSDGMNSGRCSDISSLSTEKRGPIHEQSDTITINSQADAPAPVVEAGSIWPAGVLTLLVCSYKRSLDEVTICRVWWTHLRTAL